MARTITEIKSSIMESVASDSTLSSNLTSTSRTAIYSLWAYVVAVAIWALETIVDQRNAEVEQLLAERKAHTKNWYRSKVLAFQYGDNLVDGEDIYAVEDESKMIVKFAAVVEVFDAGLSTLLIKAAKGNSVPEQLTTAEKTALEGYVNEIKDAGVYIDLRSDAADDLLPTMKIYYDPQILQVADSKLISITTGQSVVENAIINYLQNLPFNGELSLTKLIDSVQAVNGVSDVFVQNCVVTNPAYPDGLSVTDKLVSYSGYFELNDLTFNGFIYVEI